MGQAFGNGFTALAQDMALMSAGVTLIGVTCLGLGLQFSIFDHNVISWLKNSILRLVAGSLVTSTAAGMATFLTQNFR